MSEPWIGCLLINSMSLIEGLNGYVYKIHHFVLKGSLIMGVTSIMFTGPATLRDDVGYTPGTAILGCLRVNTLPTM